MTPHQAWRWGVEPVQRHPLVWLTLGAIAAGLPAGLAAGIAIGRATSKVQR